MRGVSGRGGPGAATLVTSADIVSGGTRGAEPMFCDRGESRDRDPLSAAGASGAGYRPSGTGNGGADYRRTGGRSGYDSHRGGGVGSGGGAAYVDMSSLPRNDYGYQYDYDDEDDDERCATRRWQQQQVPGNPDRLRGGGGGGEYSSGGAPAEVVELYGRDAPVIAQRRTQRGPQTRPPPADWGNGSYGAGGGVTVSSRRYQHMEKDSIDI